MSAISHFLSSPFSSDLRISEYDNINKNLMLLRATLSVDDLKGVIQSSELFWLAFCKEASHLKGKIIEIFSTSISGNNLIISGKKRYIANIRKIIEVVRNLCIKNLGMKSFTLLPIEVCGNYFLSEQADVIDLTDWIYNKRNKISRSLFEAYIRPCMQGLFKAVGVIYSERTINQSFFCLSPELVQNQPVNSMKIEWDSSIHYVYPIPPKSIPQRDDLLKSIYSMYESQMLCDFTLIAKDGSIKVHSMPFFLYGGEVMQKMLASNRKVFCENKYTLKTIKSFTNFTYLGKEGLELNSVLKSGVDICELFDMAHVYQVKPLIDCCTNLFTLLCSIENIDKVEQLANHYKNEHLKELHHYLLMKQNPGKPSL